ncbi:hypothetical protein BU14_2095s0001 [Porphyra umbilicalis]|uniref:Uncharacterized protein n=1 Tax=Porphyra umbilicalis TaxID=2786 RepID=A0A1X6NJY1_PORUM|nr:hypothetical protein BU14_2095s0001 [Porphyra umbilicalis]|eukprot:OSX68917.1 hypothetical protein BU14_2095s0001 [Porphyra umbilicalis]
MKELSGVTDHAADDDGGLAADGDGSDSDTDEDGGVEFDDDDIEELRAVDRAAAHQMTDDGLDEDTDGEEDEDDTASESDSDMESIDTLSDDEGWAANVPGGAPTVLRSAMDSPPVDHEDGSWAAGMSDDDKSSDDEEDDDEEGDDADDSDDEATSAVVREGADAGTAGAKGAADGAAGATVTAWAPPASGAEADHEAVRRVQVGDYVALSPSSPFLAGDEASP